MDGWVLGGLGGEHFKLFVTFRNLSYTNIIKRTSLTITFMVIIVSFSSNASSVYYELFLYLCSLFLACLDMEDLLHLCIWGGIAS